MTEEQVLVADIGGTNTRFALARRNVLTPKARPIITDFWKARGDDYESFQLAAAEYLKQSGARPDRAVLAAAGPVIGDTVKFTNRNWTIHTADLSDLIAPEKVTLLNDFVAMARSAPVLNEDEYEVIHELPRDEQAPFVVAGPGTGLGVAAVTPFGQYYAIIGGEGGHQAFSPQDELEIEMLRRLLARHGYVSNELVCAGIGFEEMFKLVCEIHDDPRDGLTAGEVLKLADEGDALCLTFCQMRANVAMTAIGDTALAAAARGGAWLAGGVTQRLAKYFKTETALARFQQRGIQTPLMRSIPIYMITSDEAALIGAAAYRRPD